jgi:murein DD-endopeptidase MepM/ murein hydrolase activator NlpD
MSFNPLAIGLAVAALAATGWSAAPPSSPTTPNARLAPTATLGGHGVIAPRGVWPLDDAHVLRGFDGPSAYAAGHRGVDLMAAPRQAVRSTLAGRVSVAGQVAGRPVVVIEHVNGVRTTYLPVTAVVKVGEKVGRGAVIGHVVAGPHCGVTTCLHWGARRGDDYLDPTTLLGRTWERVVLLPGG